MSERMTSISLPGISGSGIADYGRKTASEMIDAFRKHALYEKARADAVLTALDSDFRVETYIGALVERRKEVLQEGRAS